jgi:hypothetical protein
VWDTEVSAGCFFSKLPAKELPDPVSNIYRLYSAAQSVNLNGSEDLFPDLAVFNYPGSGNEPVNVFILFGNGDGTFDDAVLVFIHNKLGRMAPANSLLFADFDSDRIGDVIMGFDDDGQPGAAWFYKGSPNGSFLHTVAPLALDLNPIDDTGYDRPGASGSAKAFDVDFDGATDILVGHFVQAWTPSTGEIRLYKGKGDGTFETNFTIVGNQNNSQCHRFQIPQRLCSQF